MLNKSAYLIREHVGILKLTNTYDIVEPETQLQIAIAQEKPGILIHVLRMLIHKRILPSQVFVYEGSNTQDDSKLLFQIRKGMSLLTSKLEICDKQGKSVGSLISKAFTIGGAFKIFDASGNQFGTVKGNWKGWSFQITDMAQNEIGTISKKWAGLGKELFSSADNYFVSLKSPSPASTVLLLAAGLAIDMIYKEK